MGSIKKPVRGTQLNRSHPLARGLCRAFLFNEGTGKISWDLCGTGDYFKISSTDATLSWEANGVRTDGSTRDRWESNIALSASHPMNGSKITCVLIVDLKRLTNDGSDYTYMVHGPFILIYNSSTNILELQRMTSSLYATYKCTANQLTTGRHVFVMTLDFPVTCSLYLDGVLPPYTDRWGGSGTLTTLTDPMYLANLYNDYNYSTDAVFEAFYCYDRELTPEEAAYISQNPYCIFASDWDIGAFEYGSGPKWNTITPAKWNGVDWGNLKWNGM